MAYGSPKVWELVLPYLLVSALLMQVSTGLTCYNYSGIDDGSFTHLTHPTVSCQPQHQTCVEGINWARNGNQTVTIVHRGCSDRNPITGSFVSSNPNLLSYTYYKFCSDSLCNWLARTGQTREPLHNGAECPACLAFAPEDCADAKKIKCLGEETYCFNGTRTVSIGGAKVSMVLQTCVKPNTCNSQSNFQNLITIEERGNCFPGVPHASENSSGPCFLLHTLLLSLALITYGL